MKILVLGDIHGRDCWLDILNKEQPDLTIFLGDFITTHEDYSPEEQLTQLEKILTLKEQFPDKFIILRGNHDLDGLGYYWAACYPIPGARVRELMHHNEPFGVRFLQNSQWLYQCDIQDHKTVFSHAGISYTWLSQILGMTDLEDMQQVLVNINMMPPSEKFGFNGSRWDDYGTDPQQSCTWIRPQTLVMVGIPEYDQVVGHTGTYGGCRQIPFENDPTRSLWLCDALEQKCYLTIEDGQYKQKSL